MIPDIDAYEAALKSTAYYHQPQAGFLRVAGRDRLGFLQRQTTNDLRHLVADNCVSTVLTSPTARIMDVLCVFDEGEWLGLVTLPGRNENTSKFLRARIFFSDQITLDDASGSLSQILLFGPQKDSILEKLGLQPPALDHAIRAEIANQSITVIGQKNLMETGYRLLVPTTSVDAVFDVLDEAGVARLDPETYETLRVEAGQPGPTGELVDVHTPLEVGLRELISDSKGCYTGQEVIARQITYDKIAKKLVGIQLSDWVGVGVEIKIEGKSAGSLTSVVDSPRFGLIGLAVVRRQYCEEGCEISMVGEDGSAASGKIADLPFS